MNSYNLGVKDTLDIVEKFLKSKNKSDPFVEDMLNSLLVNETHEERNNLLFMIKGNHEIQKILSYIVSNYLTNGAIAYEDKISDIVYKTNIEEKLESHFYRDMSMGKFKYFSIIIDVLTVEKIRDIVLNKTLYTNKILKVNRMIREIKSSIINKEFACCFRNK